MNNKFDLNDPETINYLFEEDNDNDSCENSYDENFNEEEQRKDVIGCIDDWDDDDDGGIRVDELDKK